MSQVISFITYFFTSIYNALDVKIFPDMPITYSQFIIGLFVLMALIKYLLFLSKSSAHSFSINNFPSKQNSNNDNNDKRGG